jgi:PAS domain S-box-containing protein
LLSHLNDVAVLVVDRELRYIGAGGAGLGAAGWDPTELLGHTVHELVPAAEATLLAERYLRALDGEVVRFQHRGERSPDRLHDVEIVPLRGGDGAIGSVLVISHDVTAPLAAATELSEQEQRLRALAGSSADMLALYDLDGIYLEVSPAATTLFGWAPEELVGTSSYDYFHPDDLALVSETHAEVLATDQVGPIEYRLRCKDGSYRWVEVVGRNLRHPHTGELTAIQCTTRDTQRRRQAEEALRASEARLRTAMLHAPIGNALVAMDGTFLAVNDVFGAIVGADPEALVGTSYVSLLEQGDIELPSPPLGSVAPDAHAPTVAEARFRRPDGTEVDLDLHVALVRGPAGEAVNAIVQVVDTTASRRATAELQRANEELQRFASVASHDLRSPLGTAHGLLELLGTRIPLSDQEAVRDVVQRAQRQLERLGDTVDALLELTRAGTEPLRVREVPVATLLADVTDALRPLIDRAGSTIELVSDATLTGDPRLLHSLVQNLVSNALRSTDVDRPVHVRVTATRAAPAWSLAVVDDGDGFPAGLRDRVFELFAHEERSGQQPGHGLGLAICSRIVERHGGTIEVDHLDPGTRVRVVVPVMQDGAETSP